MYNDGRNNYGLLHDIMMILHGKFRKVEEVEGTNQFAISFPFYNKEKMSFGNLIRIFSDTKENLEHFDLKSSFNHQGDEDIFFISTIKSIDLDENKANIKYYRYQKLPSHNKNQKIKDYAKYNDCTIKEAREVLKDYKRVSEYPFIEMVSGNQKNKYPLIIKKESIDLDNKMPVNFSKCSSYGLNVVIPEW